MKKQSNNKGISVVVILLFIAIILAVAFYFVWKSITPTQPIPSAPPIGETSIPIFKTPAPTPTPRGTPIPLSSGPATYAIGQSSHQGPSFGTVTFDPLDVKKGQTLTLTVTATSTSPINSLTAVLNEDTTNQNITFKVSSGTGTDGTWTGTVTLNDSVDYRYVLQITATAGGVSNSVTVAPRS